MNAWKKIRLGTLNRIAALPPNLSTRDKLLYRLVYLLGAIQEWLLRSAIGVSCWRSADGRVLRMVDMSDNHLGHTLRMLERRNETDCFYYPALCAENQRRLAARGCAVAVRAQARRNSEEIIHPDGK